MAKTTETTKMRSKKAQEKSSTERIFGSKVYSHGYTGVPNILLRAQNRLGITPTQLTIIVQLLGYYFDPLRPPFPSKRELANRIGITEQTIRINIKALEDNGLVAREQQKTRFGDYGSNRYHLTGLIEKLKKFEPDFEKERKERKEARNLTETPNACANVRDIARVTKGKSNGGTE